MRKQKALTWYKHEPQSFLVGVQGMGAELIGAYTVILNLMYARGGELVRDDHHLSGVLGCSKRKAESLTDRLITIGKIDIIDGFITNSRVVNELAVSRATIEQRTTAQRARRETEGACNDINGLKDKHASLKPPRIDKNRIDSKELTTFVPKIEKNQTGIEQFKGILSPHIREDILRDFCAHRKVKKAAFSETAAKMFLKAAHDCGMTPNQAAATAIERNWITVKPEWLKNSSRVSAPRTIAESAAKASAERKRNEQQSIFDAVEPETGNSIRHNRSLGVLDRLAEPKLPD